jgi:hypothetical protein
VAAEHNALMCYDNVSSLPQWLSDALASLATGSGFGRRQMYGHDDERVYGDARPICFNGIPDFAESPDLLDRAIKITLPEIPDSKRQTDEQVWAEFERVRPGVLGDLLNMVAHGLANDVPVPNLPRIASSAKWVVNCMGSSEFLAAYAENRQAVADLALGNSALAQALLILCGLDPGRKGVDWPDCVRIKMPWEGTATDLLEILNNDGNSPVPGCLRDARDWPKGTNLLSAQLARLAPDLARKGVVVQRSKSHRNGRRFQIRMA